MALPAVIIEFLRHDAVCVCLGNSIAETHFPVYNQSKTMLLQRCLWKEDQDVITAAKQIPKTKIQNPKSKIQT